MSPAKRAAAKKAAAKAPQKAPVRRGDPPGEYEYQSAGLPGRLLRARLRFGLNRGDELSKTEVAEEVGISAVTYGRYETGEMEPGLKMIERLAMVLDTTPEWLVFEVGDGTVLAHAPSMPLVPARTRVELEAAKKKDARKRG